MLKFTWKHFDAKFKHTLDALAKHKQLIETQGTVLHLQQYKEDRARMFEAFERRQEEENDNKLRATLLRLCDVDNKVEFEKACAAREESPATGEWILENVKVKDWKDEALPRAPVLWIHGIPGAGESLGNPWTQLC